MRTDNVRIANITKNIVLVTTADLVTLTNMFCRVSEYNESSFDDIRGKIFTLGYYRQRYAESRGGMTYHPTKFVRGDWSGFNVPKKAFKPFVEGLFDPLTEAEECLIELLRPRSDDYYVIGVSRDEGVEHIDHEIMHGMFATIEPYKEQVFDIVDEVPKEQFENFSRMLDDWGYARAVHVDEFHAYVGADFDWLHEKKADKLKRFGVKLDRETSDALVALREEYFSPLREDWKNLLKD